MLRIARPSPEADELRMIAAQMLQMIWNRFEHDLGH